jgi:transposase InsO family protein
VAAPNRNRVIARSIVEGGLSAADAAARFGISRQWATTLARRWRAGGDDAVDPGSRRPHNSPAATPVEVRERILSLRDDLESSGLDAGPHSIHDRLIRADATGPSVTTIWRILKAADAIIPQPQKRPKSSIRRFEAAQPNETWQSDMTHWYLADGTGIEILSWLDDHARFLLRITCHQVVTAPIVTAEFTAAARDHGLPASCLTDNGLIFTTRFAAGSGGPNHFEHVLARHGVTQKNGHPGHPQTQGKIERFHQTLKRWLTAQPPARDLEELTAQLTAFRDTYNHDRPHRALNRRTPAETYQALPKATPTLRDGERHWRIRFDTVDTNGTVTLRWAGRLRHLGIGRPWKQTPVTILTAGDEVLITTRAGELIAEFALNPELDYHPKTRQPNPPTRVRLSTMS